jgi:hypothetical protein
MLLFWTLSIVWGVFKQSVLETGFVLGYNTVNSAARRQPPADVWLINNILEDTESLYRNRTGVTHFVFLGIGVRSPVDAR